ncbi:MAG: FAD-dependent oxidoreductase [Paracoccaceae bacterium]
MPLKNRRTDTLIIGNGALALFLAEELSRRGTTNDITVVGPSHRLGGASQAAGAMLGCFCEVTADTFRTDEGRSRFEIGVKSHELWNDTLERLTDLSPSLKPLKVAEETHVILNSVGSDFDSTNFEAMVDALNSYQRPWSDVDPAEITGFNPQPNSRAFRAIKLPNEGAIDARAVLETLETALQRSGVSLIDQTVRRVLQKSGQVVGVELHSGEIIEAGVVVVAAGAKSEDLINGIDDGFGIQPTFAGLGMGLVSRRIEGTPFKSVVRTPNRAFACGLHVVPGGDGTEYLGSTNRLVPEIATGACLEDLSYFTRSAMEQLDENIEHHQVEKLLVGNRPVTLDGFPLIGALPVTGLFVMTGTYRDGFHCAPQLAVQMADEILGTPQEIHDQFRPDRRPIATKSVEESINEFAEQSVAMWYESGANAPFPTEDLFNYRREQAEKQYEFLGIDYGLNPDVLWYTIRYPSGAPKIVNYFNSHKLRTPMQASMREAHVA